MRGIAFEVERGETFGSLAGAEVAVIAMLGTVMLSIAIWQFSRAE